MSSDTHPPGAPASEAQPVTMDAARHARLLQLLSEQPALGVPVLLTGVGAGAAAYYLRSLGLEPTPVFVLGMLCGATLGLLVDALRVRARLVEAGQLLQGEAGDA